MIDGNNTFDILMLGTFSAWQRGTIQSRSLVFARELTRRGFRIAIVTTSWDMSHERAVVDFVGSIPVIHTRFNSLATIPLVLSEIHRWVNRFDPALLYLIKPRGSSGLYALAEQVLTSGKRKLVIDLDDWEGDGGWNESGQYSAIQRRMFEWQERDLPRRADHLFTASHLLYQREVHRAGGSSDHITYLPNGLGESWYRSLSAARSRSPESTRKRIVIYSRFAEFPPDWLRRFIQTLNETFHDDIVLDIVGDAEAHLAVVPHPQNLEIQAHGYVPRRRIPKILARADVAIYPYEDSLITRSKQSVKLLELLAAGCAVLVSDVGEAPATVSDAGIVVAGGNPEDFAIETAELLRDASRMQSISKAATSRVEEHFLVRGLTDQMEQTLKALGVGSPT